ILENREGAPRLLLRRLDELDPLRLQLLVGLLHVVARERPVEERADALFVPIGGEEDDAGLRRADAELDPALLAHRLVGDDLEAELLGVEGYGGLLVAGRDAHELEMRNHAPILRTRHAAVQRNPQLDAWQLDG